MAIFSLLPVLFIVLGIARSAPPVVPCSAPISPEHGQAFLYQEGSVVKYACEPGYALRGKEIVRCIDGEWEDPNPACIEIGAKQDLKDTDVEPNIVVPPSRPLFSWGSDSEDDNEQEVNSTSEEIPLSDEARIRLLMYPRRRARIVTSPVRTGKLQSSTELEEEEKRSQKEKTSDSSTSTTIHLDRPPSVVYVRRTVKPGKSEGARAASLSMSVENGHDVEVISLPTSAVSLDKSLQTDEVLRQLYYYPHYAYPRAASLAEYRSGAPVVMSLTESQLAWINSLHPELRDRYLKDLYAMRAEEVAESDKALAFLRRHEDAYNYMYTVPYLRRPISLVMEDPVDTYDYTCHESGYPFIKAPKLRNMHIHRYDRRQNPNSPYNHYLAAVYRCNPGYVMADTRYTELFCKKKGWTGVRPVCVPSS